MEENEDFRWVAEGEVRKLILAEVFPEDTGEYTCEVENRAGRVKTTCHLTVEGFSRFKISLVFTSLVLNFFVSILLFMFSCLYRFKSVVF